MKTTTKKVMALAIFSSTLLFSGCQKDLYDPEYVASKNGLITGVPSTFNWSTISSVNLTVNVDDQFLGQYNYVVEVFDQNPIIVSNAKLLTKGLAKQGQAFVATFTIPQALKTVYIRQTAPDGLKVVRSYDLSGSTLVCDFRATKTKSVATKSVVKKSSIADTTYPTPSNAIEINSTSSKKYNIEAGKSYVIKKGAVYDGDISFSWDDTKKFLYVEGEWKISSDIQLGNGTIVILQNEGKITFSKNAKLSIQGSSDSPGSLWIMQGGTLNPSKTANVNIYETNYGSCNNLGAMYVNDITLDSNTTLNNTGTIVATGTLGANNQESTITNDGKFTVETITFSSQPIINNNCYFKVNKTASLAGATCNLGGNSYLGTTTMKCGTGTTFNMSASSILEATESASFGSKDKIIGIGSDYAVAKFKKLTAGSGGLNISGNLEFECSDYTQNTDNDKYCTIVAPAQTVEYGSPTVAIASDPNGCTGPGSTPKVDPPKDTKYPLDVNLGTTYTYAMEDLWPNYGDYDMNDIVLAITPKYTLNSAAYVKSMTMDVDLKAVGATKSLAAAIQLDNVAKENVTGITYSVQSTDGSVFEVGSNMVEVDQAKAVIPLFDDAHGFLRSSGITNTIKSGSSVPNKTVTITITFADNTVTSANISDIQNALNFFIVTDKKKTTRTEIHLRGFKATDHVNKSLFGTGVDNSSKKSYSSIDNLVWGMVIPTDFNYPTENTNIQNAYPNFRSWAISDGQNNQDWYITPASGLTY
ncbi:LruC domain-containing protein [uncultured Bacteroides sp.]|uniref:LruC domain-containing protein n=1 Tax=uncultured Bacteroides sp. TaxID=162156 RepID=UPI002AA67906|nr:LruC domain-containing protein [uncultured Bacteroides sp.]